MITNEEIKSFLEGNDPEQFIVAIEFDYVTNSIYKIKEIPKKEKPPIAIKPKGKRGRPKNPETKKIAQQTASEQKPL